MLECTKKWYNYTPQTVVVPKVKKEAKDKTGAARRQRKEKPKRRNPPNGPMLEEIIIAKFMSVPVEEILGKSRFEEIVAARHMVWYFLYRYPWMTLAVIGKRYGVHHSTVQNGLAKIESQTTYKWYREQLQQIRELINAE